MPAHYKLKKKSPPKFACFLSPTINMDHFYALPFSQMALPFETEEGEIMSDAVANQNNHSTADDNQQADFLSLWEEHPPQLEEIVSEEEVDEFVVFGDHELIVGHHIRDNAYWVTLPNEVSWNSVWQEQMAQDNLRSEDESSSEDDENDTLAWHDRHRQWWHPPRYVVFCATRSNDRTG